MSKVVRLANEAALDQAPEGQQQLVIIDRPEPEDLKEIARELASLRFQVFGTVALDSAEETIIRLLQETLPEYCLELPHIDILIADLVQNCRFFARILGKRKVGFWFGTERGCRRFHVDNVPLRLLVTYSGQGTEWIADEFADRSAYINGASNDEIVRDAAAVQHLKAWQIGVFRGGDDGVLHRTPESAQQGNSLLLRLDVPTFWTGSARTPSRALV